MGVGSRDWGSALSPLAIAELYGDSNKKAGLIVAGDGGGGAGGVLGQVKPMKSIDELLHVICGLCAEQLCVRDAI